MGQEILRVEARRLVEMGFRHEQRCRFLTRHRGGWNRLFWLT